MEILCMGQAPTFVLHNLNCSTLYPSLVAHDFPDQHRQKAENFNAAREYSDYLLAVTRNIEQYIQQHYGVAFCD